MHLFLTLAGGTYASSERYRNLGLHGLVLEFACQPWGLFQEPGSRAET
jgi:hypothetical protein